jgi:hypothetical protein
VVELTNQENQTPQNKIKNVGINPFLI